MSRMKEIRLQKGLKQKDVASITGLSKPAISLFENGKSKPSMNSAFKIAQALGVTVDELFSLDFLNEIVERKFLGV
ncbi:helix-turn-helix transcriptional regulator [Oceanobacillus chungangensis]|uniref:XRE family transcriptional regulator n=1 Tax=Oceanobacillus chungangensis TaxID=1229152 RepID=A0A3D8PL56_9BACI|nr:helix-turn-helix transcriptional regulator [Oceanobacillus chungangensis]RDW15961.1 XRE family transcriptional regulator [Oceanobacillus chungangensis]